MVQISSRAHSGPASRDSRLERRASGSLGAHCFRSPASLPSPGRRRNPITGPVRAMELRAELLEMVIIIIAIIAIAATTASIVAVQQTSSPASAPLHLISSNRSDLRLKRRRRAPTQLLLTRNASPLGRGGSGAARSRALGRPARVLLVGAPLPLATSSPHWPRASTRPALCPPPASCPNS